MPLVKIRNNTPTIIFIDSVNLTIRPYKSPTDFMLIDEAKVERVVFTVTETIKQVVVLQVPSALT